MGEFVGVDPKRLEELTKRLERLHDALAARGPQIVQLMRKWGSRQDLGLIPRLVAATADDARDMDTRTRKAYEVAELQGWKPRQVAATQRLGADGTVRSVPSKDDPPKVRIDWTVTGDSRFQARQDAAALAAAVRGTDPKVRAAAIAEVARRVAAHTGDSAYLTVFWKSAARDAARVARLLQQAAPPGPKLLDKNGAAALSALAASLAAATELNDKAGKPIVGKEILDCPDLWSVGMLLKYGPHGSAWDSRLLADITRKLLDARAEGRIKVPEPRLVSKDALDRSRVDREYQQVLAEFDPVVAALDRAAENGKAARHVLGDPETGLKYAKMLLNDDWRTPGTDPSAYFKGSFRSVPGLVPLPRLYQVDLSAHPAAFLKAAVSAERGTGLDAKESAWSVVNIVQAVSKLAEANPQKTFPENFRNTFKYIADRYMYDFAGSAAHDYQSKAIHQGDDGSKPWIAVVRRSELAFFIGRTFLTQKEFDHFKGVMDAKMVLAVGATVVDRSGKNYLKEMGGLYGLVQDVQAYKGYEEGKRQDAAAERYKTAIDILTSGYGALSFSNPTGVGVASQIVTALSKPVVSESFETGKAVDALVESSRDFRDKVLASEVLVVQGLMNSGALNPPEGASWVKNGVIHPNAEFADWVNEHDRITYHDRTLGEWIRDVRDAMKDQKS